MAGTSIILTGDKRLNRKLAKLAAKDAKKIVRKAARPALRPIRAEAKANAPRRTGALRRAIKVRALRRTRRAVGARVQVGKKFFTGDQFYAAFVEFGHRIGPRRLGNSRRLVEGQGFLKRAAQTKRRVALAIYRRLVRAGILEAIK